MADKITLTIPVAKVLAAFLNDPTNDRYGLDLMHATDLSSGTLYPILVRLATAGWIHAHWEDTDPVAAGRPARRYYRLTPDGAVLARTELAALHAQTRRPPAVTTRPAGATS